MSAAVKTWHVALGSQTHATGDTNTPLTPHLACLPRHAPSALVYDHWRESGVSPVLPVNVDITP